MKALVTGGAGFIGSNVVKVLIEHGHDVSVLDNLSSGYRENLASFPQAEVVEGDVRDAEALARAIAGAEVGLPSRRLGRQRAFDRRIRSDDAEINVHRHAAACSRRRATAASGRWCFRRRRGFSASSKTLPIREDHPVEPDTPYGASKLGAEKLCLAYAKLYPLECVCLRYFNVYGMNQRYDAYGNVIPIFAHRALRGQPLVIYGDGEQTRDFVNVQRRGDGELPGRACRAASRCLQHRQRRRGSRSTSSPR